MAAATPFAAKEFSCRFNGGCGSSFESETDYLRHVVKHLKIRGTTTKEIVRGFREQSRNLTEDRYAFDCLIPRRTLTVYNQEKSRELLESKNDRQISLPSSCQSWGTQKEEGTVTQKKNMNKKKIRNENYWFPVYELVLDRFQAQQDELVPNGKSRVKMEDVLPCQSHMRKDCGTTTVTPSDGRVLGNNPNWKELLRNFPSVADDMSPAEVAAATTRIPKVPAQDVLWTSKLNYNRNYSALPDFSVTVMPTAEGSPLSRHQTVSNARSSAHSIASSSSSLSGRGKDMHRLRLVMTPPAKNKENNNNPHPQNYHDHSYGPEPSSKFNKIKQRLNENAISRRHPSFFNSTGRVRKLFPGLLSRTTQLFRRTIQKRRCNRFKRQLNIDREYYSSEYILEEGLKKKRASGVFYLKPYVCPVPKCGKSYKNPNGIKYHAKYGHSAPQQFPCPCCGKLYSTMHSLLAHKKTHAIPRSSESAEEFQSTSSSDCSSSDLDRYSESSSSSSSTATTTSSSSSSSSSTDSIRMNEHWS